MQRVGHFLMLLLMFSQLGCAPPAAQPTGNHSTDEAVQPLNAVAKAAPVGGEDNQDNEGEKGSGNQPATKTTAVIAPSDLVYLGAFRLPQPTGGSNWEYSGYAATYYPRGDAGGSKDAFPGSIFAVGHDHQQMVSEINIPVPVVSAEKNLRELNAAETLQPFRDIRGGKFGGLEIPRAGIEYLPAAGGSGAGKLHFCWGQHFQFEHDASHGWSDLDLVAPNTQGLWYIGQYSNYVTNDYLFEIPKSWADRHLPGYRLATGRFRDGTWGGLGPAILAYVPPAENNTPAAGATIEKVKTLLMYGAPQPGSPELEVNPKRKMKEFSEADEWSGGAWLTAGDRSAVVLVGTKGTGKTWYGFANGVVYPTSGDPSEPVPDVPPFPYDARGWWSAGISAQILFFDPAQLAAVARGELEPWEPQPYAVLAIDKYLFEPGYDHVRQKRYLLGACCFDRERGALYVFERQVKQDEERSLVHAFRIGQPS